MAFRINLIIAFRIALTAEKSSGDIASRQKVRVDAIIPDQPDDGVPYQPNYGIPYRPDGRGVFGGHRQPPTGRPPSLKRLQWDWKESPKQEPSLRPESHKP